jgi:hypothetical protein
MRAVLAVALVVVFALPARAVAVIHPAGVLDGPANDILDVDGAALAPDGSGGVVYRKVVDGVTHVFAVPFRNGAWGGPVEVDGEDAFGASQPAIAAGDGGRLLVVWVQPRNVSPRDVVEYALMSASLQPGAGAFGQEIMVDPNVGEPDTGDIGGVQPRLAMAPDGVAYVVYRVTTDDCNSSNDNGNPEEPKCRQGSSDEVVYVRAARFHYLTWSSLGTINRAPQIPMRAPTPSNAPAVGIDVNGNGIVAWQEPDASGVARIWVRRLFGAVKGNVLQASPETIGGRPVTSDAEAPAVAVSRFGEARIAFLIKGASGSAVPVTQLYDNSIASEFDPHGSMLQGAQPVVGASADGLGSPSASVGSSGDFRLAWSQGGAARELAGGEESMGRAVQVGVTSGPVSTTVNPAGGGTTVWPASAGGLPVVEAREEYAHGAYQTAELAGGLPGVVSGLSFGGSGEGDALVGWMQGPAGRSEVVGDFVQAPAAPFLLSTSVGWVRAPQANVEWESTTDAVAGVTYAVYVDGRAVLQGLTGAHASLSSVLLGDGVHQVQILATDSAGQRTMSAESALKIDTSPPIVKVASIDRHRGVRVTVRDEASGVDGGATAISFGDGKHENRRTTVSHVYARPGSYTVTALVRDKVGNHATIHLRVHIR